MTTAKQTARLSVCPTCGGPSTRYQFVNGGPRYEAVTDTATDAEIARLRTAVEGCQALDALNAMTEIARKLAINASQTYQRDHGQWDDLRPCDAPECQTIRALLGTSVVAELLREEPQQ